MTQKKAQLMYPPEEGRVGAVKAGTGISIDTDGTICATGGDGGVTQIIAGTNVTIDPTEGTGAVTISASGEGGPSVFFADAENNIWSCNTSINPDGAANNFLVGVDAGANLTGACNRSNTFIGKYAGFCAGTGGYTYDNFFAGERAGEKLSNGYNNNFVGYKAGGNATSGCNNNFTGACSGQNEYGSYNNYVGFRAGKGTESAGRLTGWELVSATILPGQEDEYYYRIRVDLPSGGVVQGWVLRDNGELDFSKSDTLLFSSLGPVIDGETIVIPGNQIGGSSPADDATVNLYSDTIDSENNASIAIGNYAASENNGRADSNIAIGPYAGQYSGYNNEFNHLYMGSSAGRFANGGFYNLFIGAYAGECAGGASSFSNTFIGTLAGNLAANSFYQTFVGAYSGQSVVNPQGWTGPGNQLFGAFSGTELTTGVANSMFGSYAGYATTTGTYNSFFGSFAGEGFITGSYNAVFGTYSGSQCYFDEGFAGNPAGVRSSTGSYNTNVGSRSGAFQPGNSSGNVAVGYESNSGTLYGLCALTVGTSTAVPSGAYCSYVISTDCVSTATISGSSPGLIKVFRNGSGTVCDVSVIDPGRRQQNRIFTCIPGTLIGGTSADNLPIASRTLFSSNDTCNFDNTFIGPFAGQMTTFGTRNFFGGFRAGGWSGDYSTDNVAIGSYAGFCMSGGYNVAIGCCAGALSGGYFNVAIGLEAGCCTSGNFSVSIGGCAGANNTADQTVFVGWRAGQYNTTGFGNTFVGSGSGRDNTTGDSNSFFGGSAGGSVTTGEGNTFVGVAAAQNTTTGSRNVAVGCSALQSASTNSNNVAVGHCALPHVINLPGCDWNVAIGSEALRQGAVGSVAIGGCTLSRVIGNCSTAVGYFALKGTAPSELGPYCTNSGNSVFGWCSTVGITTGSENSTFGLFSGLANSSGSFNTFFGSRSGCNNTTGGNNVAIGSCAGTDAVLNLTTQSNQIVVGNNDHTNAFIKIGWTVTSDERDKTCVSQISHGREFLQKLEPVQFNWKDRESDKVTDEKPRYGFLAQQVLNAEGEPSVLVDDSDPEHLKLRESMMIPVLFKIIQEMDEELRALRSEVDALRG